MVLGEELCYVLILTSEAFVLLQDFLCQFHKITLL